MESDWDWYKRIENQKWSESFKKMLSQRDGYRIHLCIAGGNASENESARR